MKVLDIGFNVPSGFSDLPMEIIHNIFRYLNFGDIQSACLVCCRWCVASQDPEFQSKVLVKFTKTHLSDDSFPGNLFLNTFRTFPNIYLKTTLGVVNKLFSLIGPMVENIVFDNINITEEQFSAIIKKTPNLKALAIIGPLFTEGQFFNSKTGQELLVASLRNIREITIKKNLGLTATILHPSTSLTPNLEQITVDPSFEFLMNVIENHVTTLKELHLNDIAIHGNLSFSSLAKIKGLNLRRFECINFYPSHFKGLETLLKSQKNLVELNLSRTGISDIGLEIICEHLTKLEVLKLRGCREIFSANIVGVSEVKGLKVLDISACDIMSNRVQEGIAKVKNYTLLELYLNENSKLSEACLIQCAENFPNLRIFDISHCRKGVTDKVVQAIIKNLAWLRFLSLNGCSLITDAGLTGISEKAQLSRETDLSASSSDENEMNQMGVRIEDGLSVKKLKGLKTLQLQWCGKITNASLIYGLQFLELKNLNLSGCGLISLTGIEALVENCPSIEVLNISCCRNINKECIEVISQRLQRLQFLDIGVCFQLIDQFYYVVTNCKALRVLKLDLFAKDRAIQKIRQSGVKMSRNLCLNHSGTLLSVG